MGSNLHDLINEGFAYLTGYTVTEVSLRGILVGIIEIPIMLLCIP